MKIIDLPEDLLRYFHSSQYLKHYEWKRLMNISVVWKSLKSKSVFLKINEKFSVKYFNSLKLREKVHQSVEDSMSQIALKYTYRSWIDDFTPFMEIYSLTLIGSFVNNSHLSALSHLHMLKLSHCDITDVTALSMIHTLDLSGNSRLINVAPLHSVPILTLSNCPSLKDVTCLGNHRYLDLSDCQRITDVSTLGRVPILILKNLRKLTDVSALREVTRLDLSSCVKLRDLSPLYKVPYLRLSDCKITDASLILLDGGNDDNLYPLLFLDLSHCNKLTRLSGPIFGRAKKLSLRECKNLSVASVLELSVLANCTELDIYKCPGFMRRDDLQKDQIVEELRNYTPNLRRLYFAKEKKLEYSFSSSSSIISPLSMLD
jgi:hypothetical protein